MVTRQVNLHTSSLLLAYSRRLRWFDGGMDNDSRYFAIVLLATIMPCSVSKSAILLSLNGLAGFSAATNFLMSALMAVEEHSPPLSVLT